MKKGDIVSFTGDTFGVGRIKQWKEYRPCLLLYPPGKRRTKWEVVERHYSPDLKQFTVAKVASFETEAEAKKAFEKRDKELKQEHDAMKGKNPISQLKVSAAQDLRDAQIKVLWKQYPETMQALKNGENAQEAFQLDIARLTHLRHFGKCGS